MILCAAEVFGREGRLSERYLLQLGARYVAVIVTAWLVAIALWPWLQIGNPFAQFKIALVHFATISLPFDFPYWGERITTGDLPRSYIPGQLLARLPEAFLLLLACAAAQAVAATVRFAREIAPRGRIDGRLGLRTAALLLAGQRGILVVCAAAVLPVAFLIVQHATIYDGIRHVLFIIPMLAVLAGCGFAALLPWLRRIALPAAAVGGAYIGSLIVTLAILHPLEYVNMNALAGGVRGAYGRFELDYWSVAATTALRALERRLDYENRFAGTPPRLLICLPWREAMIAPILRRPWRIETDPQKADFIIEPERSSCDPGATATLIDEVTRFDRAFARVYARRRNTENTARD
jgi:hypothetical protein